MEIIKFDISSMLAKITMPPFNGSQPSYPHIHKCTVLGILGAIIGIEKDKMKYKSDSKKQEKQEKHPTYYEKLKDIDVAITPYKESFPSVITQITDTTRMYNKGENIVNTVELLVNPKWTVYIKSDSNIYFEKIKEHLLKKQFYFIPYLGMNCFQANIENVEVLEGQCIEDFKSIKKIDSFFIKENVKHGEDEDGDGVRIYSGIRIMPIGYIDGLYQYNEKQMLYTNDSITAINNYSNIVKADNKVLFFI